MAHAVRLARRHRRTRGRHRWRRRREPPSQSRLAADGPEARDREVRCPARLRSGDARAEGARHRAARDALRALRVPLVAAGTPIGCRRRCVGVRRARRDRRRTSAARVRGDPRQRGTRPLDREDRRRADHVLRHRDDESRSDGGATRRPVVRRDAARGRVPAARAPLPGRARPARLRRDARAAASVVRGHVEAEARAEREVRPARDGEPRHRRAGRRARHAARVVRRREPQAARHGFDGDAPSRREDDLLRGSRRQGCEPHRLRPGEHRARDRVFRGGRRHHAAAASRARAAGRVGREARARLS